MGNVFKAQFNCGDALVNRCCDCIGARCVYVSELEENLRDLDNAVNSLESLKNDVKRRIDIEERQGMKRKDQVQHWLSDLNLIDIREKLLINGEQEINKLCIGGCCSVNYFSSYKFGKKVVDRLKEVNDQLRRGKEFIKEVATLKLPDPMVMIPSEPTLGLENNLKIVCSYLLEEDVGIVGLYGSGGVGKTALLKQVNNKICLEYNRIFDLLIWTPVSKQSNQESIQNHIGKKIGFFSEEWRSKSLDEKAIDILHVLMNKKFVLLLDDVWELVNLTEIGVPLTKPNECKVIFTTRSEKICNLMCAKRIVKMQPLALEEARMLFTPIVGENTLNSDPEIYRLAEELVKGCQGVPQTLIKIAQEMSCNRSIQDWKNAITSLKNPVSRDSLGKLLGDDERDLIAGAKLGHKNAFGNPITDKTIREMPQYKSGEEITARHRASVALASEMKYNQDVEAREYMKQLKIRYGDKVGMIGLIYNATGGTLKYVTHKDWHGNPRQGLYPMKVDNGQWGVLLHLDEKSSVCGHSGSMGAVVYRGVSASGDTCDWMLAWSNPPVGAEAHTKVFTEVREKDHFPQFWYFIQDLLSKSDQRREDAWDGCTSKITLDDTDGPFFEATLSLKLAF